MDSRDANQRLDELQEKLDKKIIGTYTNDKTIAERLDALEKSVNGTGSEEDFWKDSEASARGARCDLTAGVRFAAQTIDASVSVASIGLTGASFNFGLLSVTGFVWDKAIWGTAEEMDGVKSRVGVVEGSLETFNQNVASIQRTTTEVQRIIENIRMSLAALNNKVTALLEKHE